MKALKAALVFLSAMLFIAGCTSSTKLVDGTSISLGAYFPFEGSIYGAELISYVNGAVVKVETNMLVTITRTHCSTNDWVWGMLKNSEHSSVTISTKR